MTSARALVRFSAWAECEASRCLKRGVPDMGRSLTTILGGLERFSNACMCRGLHPPYPPFARGGKSATLVFFPPCEGGIQGGSSSASALHQARHPGD